MADRKQHMDTIIFDIETGPLPETELAALLPPFDPNEVKVGNIKDDGSSGILRAARWGASYTG